MTDTERADEAVAGADEVLIGANRSVQVLAHKPRVVARKSAVRAAGESIMVTGTRSPGRACQHGEELSLAGMHRAGSCPTGGCLETSWQATLLGRGPGGRGGALGSAGAQMEIGTAGLHCCLQVVVALPSSIGQTGWAWRKRSNSLSWNVTRRKSYRCRCGRRVSEMVELMSRRSTSS